MEGVGEKGGFQKRGGYPNQSPLMQFFEKHILDFSKFTPVAAFLLLNKYLSCAATPDSVHWHIFSSVKVVFMV